MNSAAPAVVDRHLDAVKYWEDGKILLGASNLTGRYWSGSIWCFPSAEDAPNVEKCIAGIETECGITDVLSLKKVNIIVGMDSGALQVFNLQDETPPILVTKYYSHEHDDIVSSLSATSDESRFVSSSYDGSIKVWDSQTFSSFATFRPAHAGIVWQVSCSSTDPNVILSCGQDGEMLIFDLRLPKPATILNRLPLKCKPTAVAWQPQSNTKFAAGDESGAIIVRDIRESESAIQYQAHDRTVFRIAFSPSNPSLLASCADESKVLVTDVGKDCPKTILDNDDHDDFVRGLAWNSQNVLVTCGWDKKVIKHVINPSEMDVTLINGV